MQTHIYWITDRFGEKLEALQRKPEGKGPFPAVIFVSGFGMDLHEYINSNDEISKRLVQKGFLTLQFSFSGCGKSKGDYREMTLERQAQQIEDMIRWLVRQEHVDVNHIGIHATSMGVSSTLLSDYSSCTSLCLVSGVYQVKRSIHQVYAQERGVKINYAGMTELPRGSGAKTPVGPGFWKSIAIFDAVREGRRIKIPVFLIHGDQDTKVSTEEVQEVFSAIPSKSKKLKIFAGGDHGITDVTRTMREEFLNDVTEWFKQTLRRNIRCL